MAVCKFVTVFSVLVMMLASPALSAPFTDCGSDGALVNKVEVTGCENADVCPLKRGEKAKLSIDFASQSSATKLTAVVHGVISGVPLPFNVPHPDACQGSGVVCPLHDGTSYTYNNELDILSSYPPLSVSVKWELQDENGSDVVCVLIPAQIV